MRALVLPALCAVCSAFALAGCSGDNSGEASNAGGSLRFTADGARVAFPDDTETFVWCGPVDPGSKREAIHAVVSPDGLRVVPLWEFHALTKRVKPGTEIAFGGDAPAAELFIAAGETEAVSGEVPEAKGTLSIKQIDCGGDLEFSADGTLANEAGFNVMEVKGTFRGKVGKKIPRAFYRSD
jgi:hypothetical protein